MPGKDYIRRMKEFVKKRLAISIFIGYFFASIGVFLYSYTQVDLSLTLSQVNIWQTIQKIFQQIGYFNRPLSTVLFIILLILLFLLYAYLLRFVRSGHMTKNNFWKLVLMVSILLVFSYPAFSYDMFNYMFTAKTVLIYHENPYNVIPLQFTGVEPWLSFMHWTHLPSAYTPLWILLTLPAYIFGYGFFLFIMWNIKILVMSFFIASVWLVGKILHDVDPDHELFGMAIFAFNPLILIETLVSGHNDIVMMALALLAIFLFLKKKIWLSFFVLALSVAAKLMTVFLIPVHFLRWNRYWALGMICLGFLLVLTQREVLPWYWVWIMPFVALLPRRVDVLLLSGAVSLGLLLSYAPFLYFGAYDPPVPYYMNIAMIVPILISLSVLVFMNIRKYLIVR